MSFSGLLQFLKGIGNFASFIVSKAPDPNSIFADRLDRLMTVDLFETNEENDGEAENLEDWTTLNYVSARKLTADVLKTTLPAHPFVLDLSKSDVSDDVLACLSRNEYVRAVLLTGCEKITEAGLRYLKTCPKLWALVIGSELNVNEKTSIITYPNYKPATDAWLEVIATMTQLESLTITGCVNITDDGALKLGNLTQLTHISVLSCNNLSDAPRRFAERPPWRRRP